MQAQGAAGHSKFLLKRSSSEKFAGKNIAARFCLICRAKAQCGKEAFLLKSGLVTLARQSNSLRGN
jgi:hypothetical protein